MKKFLYLFFVLLGLQVALSAEDRLTLHDVSYSGDTMIVRFVSARDSVPSAVDYPADSLEAASGDALGIVEIIIIFVVLAADLCLFTFLYIKKRRQDRSGALSGGQTSGTDYSRSRRSVVSGRVSPGIYIFGNFTVLSSDGKDISAKFSPIIKELLLLLICHNHSGGVSSQTLVDTLWFDKDARSASNNRSVSITKLRSIFKELGDVRIYSNNGYWFFDPKDVYLDFYNYIDLVKGGDFDKEKIVRLLSIIDSGPLLADFTSSSSSSSWSDDLKADLSDEIMTILSRFAGTLDLSKNADFIIHICDNIEKFDSLSEAAIALKCRAFRAKGSHMLARQIYTNFVKEYQAAYGEPFPRDYSEIINF